MTVYETLDAWDAGIENWQEIVLEKIIYIITHHTILCLAIAVIFILLITLFYLIAENQRLTEEKFREIEGRWKDER